MNYNKKILVTEIKEYYIECEFDSNMSNDEIEESILRDEEFLNNVKHEDESKTINIVII